MTKRKNVAPMPARWYRAAIVACAGLASAFGAGRTASAQTLALEVGRVEGTITERGANRSIRNAFIEAVRIDAQPAVSFRATPDQRGHFRIDSLPAGRYMIQLASATLDSLDLALQANERLILAGQTVQANFSLPAGPAMRDAVCRGVKLESGRGVVVGRAIDADTELPLSNASVVVSWNELKVDKATLNTARNERGGVAPTGPRGEFRLCGVPTGSLLTLQLQHQGRAGGMARVMVSDDEGAVVRNLSLSVLNAPTLAALDSIERKIDSLGVVAEDSLGALVNYGTAVITGTVLSSTGQPVTGAEIRIANLPLSTSTDAGGKFTLNGLPAGTQLLYIRRLGYGTMAVDVELRAGTVATRDVKLERIVSLDSMRITAQRVRYAEFEDHRKTNFFGKFFTQADIDRRDPFEMTDMLSQFGGFRIEGRGPDAKVSSEFAKLNHPSCKEVNVIVDGIPRAGLNNVSPSEVAGVEIYRDAVTAPGPYRSECGLILVWTKIYKPNPRRR